jgi:threonine synthase
MGVIYQSTRGDRQALDLQAVTMAGLAPDGGLYVPVSWPQINNIAALRDKSYADCALHIISAFTPVDNWRGLIADAYAQFDNIDVTPLRQLDDRHWLLELFHGPTLAFKDVALQLLGRVFEYYLSQSGQRMTVVGATSGDTGSAAMAALAGRKNIDVFILYPDNGPSEIQRKQMTCVEADNIHALAVEGSFDDCQALVKTLFADAIWREQYRLAAVNSINWLRVLAQMVYYFVAAAKAALPRAASFVVPTGNFGNVYAGYAAMQCGLPVSKLVVASNRNDVLTRFFETGRMQPRAVQPSLSPSMDIQISSNFERLLFDLCRRDAGQATAMMNGLRMRGEFAVSPLQLATARQTFTAASADDEQTLQTIAAIYHESGVILDPHTAVGVAASRRLARELPEPVVSLACAHPAKFPDTVRRAIGVTPELPARVRRLLQNPERVTRIPANDSILKTVIQERVRA